MEITEFIKSLKVIVCHHENAEPTEEYLRRLLVQIDRNKHKNLNSDLLLEIFEAALMTTPCPFESSWNKIKEPEFYDDNDIQIMKIDPLKYVTDTIQFFVADLRRMEAKELKNPYRYYGVTSSSGARWYNFTMCSFVEANKGYNNGVAYEMDTKNLSWDFIAVFFIIGKAYE